MSALYENPIDDIDMSDAITKEEFETRRDELNKVIEMGKIVSRLSANSDFITVVVESYFTEETKRFASLLSSGKLPQKNKDGCVAGLDAIGRFRNFLQEFVDNAATSSNELSALVEAREQSILLEAGE